MQVETATVMCRNNGTVPYAVRVTCAVDGERAWLSKAFGLLQTRVWEVSLLQNVICNLASAGAESPPLLRVEERKFHERGRMHSQSSVR